MSLVTNIRLSNPFYLDLRSIGVFRVGLGIIILIDFLIRLTDLEVFYTAQGVLPIETIRPNVTSVFYRWSVLFLSDNFYYVLSVFLLGCSLSILYLFGIKPKLTGFLLWIVLVSVQNRNPLLLNGGDKMLQLFLLWSLFLPIHHFSFSNLSRILEKPAVASVSTVAIIIQLAIIYFFSALLKNHPVWREEASAMYYAIHLEQFAHKWSQVLLDYPSVLKLLTSTIYYTELIAPLLLFVPFATTYLRYIIIVVFIFFHAGTAMMFELGAFPYVGIVAWIMVLPSSFWDKNRVPYIKFEWKHLAHVVAAGLIGYILLWNIQTLKIISLPSYLRAMSEIVQVQQEWGMYAPYPTTHDGWVVVAAKEVSDKEIDLFRQGKIVNYAKPDNILGEYKNKRWQKYIYKLYYRNRTNPEYVAGYFNYLCSQHKVKSIKIVFMLEQTPAPGENFKEVVPVVLGESSCP